VSSPVDLHERTLFVETHPLAANRLHVHGELRDVRHVDITSGLGTSHPAGVVHHMALDIEIDRELKIAAVEAWMGTIPYEPTSRTWGEGCRNALPNYQRLLGTKLDAGYALRVLESVGGRLGCFHILSLAQCLPLAVRAASGRLCAGALRMPAGARGEVLDSCVEWRAGGPHWTEVREHEGSGYCDFRRQIRVRARAGGHKRLRLTADLRDESAGLESQAASLSIGLEIPSLTIAEAAAELGGMPFAGCGDPLGRVRSLEGLTIAKGFTGAALERVGGAAGCSHLSALVIALTPVVPQASRAFAGGRGAPQQQPAQGRTANPRADSCHMWRGGGPLMSLEETQGKS
jgi:Protein of unknown function (DUF2889)